MRTSWSSRSTSIHRSIRYNLSSVAMNCRSVSTFSADAIEQASSIRHRYRRTKRSVIASRYRIRTMCSCPATASWYRSSQRYFRSMTAIRRPSWTIHCFRNRRTSEKRRLHYCGQRMRRAPCGCPSCLMNQGLTINLSARIQARGAGRQDSDFTLFIQLRGGYGAPRQYGVRLAELKNASRKQ